LFGVAVDLLYHRVEVAELFLVAQFFHKFHLYTTTIQVAVEIEHMRLEQRLLAVDRGSHAKARHPGAHRIIDAMHAQGKRVLVAVGALHMTGEQGLPRLMAARGYSVERLVPP